LLDFLATILWALLIPLMRATGPALVTLLDFITLLISDEEDKRGSSSFYRFLHLLFRDSYQHYVVRQP
jgi:hypothetical protein